MPNLGSKFANFMKEPLKNTFDFLGHNPNGAVYTAVAIAAFKGVFRPIFTLTDKKSDPQTKKYTAIREALTELIAIPVYMAIPKLGEKFFVNQNAPEIVKKATTTNVKFVGVLAATAIIPAICNLVQPPIMNWLKQKQEAKNVLSAPNTVNTVNKTNKPSQPGNNPVQTKLLFKNNYGMRVGS